MEQANAASVVSADCADLGLAEKDGKEKIHLMSV